MLTLKRLLTPVCGVAASSLAEIETFVPDFVSVTEPVHTPATKGPATSGEMVLSPVDACRLTLPVKLPTI